MKNALVAAALLALACGPALRTARRAADERPSDRELEAAERMANPKCAALVTALVPGAAALCEGRTAEGAAVAGLAAAELTTAVGVALEHDVTYPGSALPLLAFSDLVLFTEFQRALDLGLARRQLYVPQDTFAELLQAPFNARVLAQPDVWAGILGSFAAGLVVTALTDGLQKPFRGKPRLFGTDFAPGLGYASGGAIGALLFEHVAIAEETTFRGYFQSGFARRFGEDRGWVYGSLLFGLLHAPNALAVDSSQRVTYLLVGVPFITLLGGYLGQSYRWHGYGLTAPVAIHFWYDFLISAASFAMDPRHNQLSGSIALPF